MDLETLTLMFMWQNKHARIFRKILKKKNYVGGLDPSDIKTYYKASIIKTVWHWHINRPMTSGIE